ncbi:MAG: EAL domain-containing protein [Nitrosomonadales bacterium]|nr:EAL domain-containing protein [Nitrosomonadales bacterium]
MLLLPLLVNAAPLQLDGATPFFALATHIEVLEDPTGRLNITQVDAAERRAAFRTALTASGTGLRDELNFGYSASTYWLRLEIAASPAASERMLLEVAFPSLDHVTLYEHSPHGWGARETGDLLPFSSRPISHRNFVFPVQLGGEAQTFYLRIQSEGTLTVPLRLWQADSFRDHNLLTYASLALYFGMLLALMLYNLLLYLSLRDRIYLTYVCFVASLAVGLLSLSGLGNQFLWRGWTAWGNVALPIGFAVGGAFGTMFTRGFLNTRVMTPGYDRVLLLLIGLFLCTALMPQLFSYRWSALAVSLLGAISSLVVISTGIACLRRNHPGARYFLLAWALLMTGVFLMAARNIGWLPTNFLTLYSIQIGSALEMLLLSFALADRINVMRQERDDAQAQALDAMGQRLQAMIDTLPDLFFYKDRNGIYSGCNKAFEVWMGKPGSEIIGKSDAELMPESQARLFREQDAQTFASEQPRRDEEWLTYPDGRQALMEVLKTPFYGAHGEVIGLTGIGRDITQRHRQGEQERARNRTFEMLARGAAMSDILGQIVSYVEQSRSDLLCSVLLLDESGQHLRLGAAPSLPDFYNQTVEGLQIGDGVGACGTAACRNERVVAENLQTDPYWADYRELVARAGLVSCWSEPICSAKGEVLGTFGIYQRKPARPNAADIELIQQAANLASIAIERKRAEDLIWQQANYDPVTQLPNRRLFRDRLQQEIRKTGRSQKILALLFIDLDRFKEVNDTLGHDVGDQLLVDAARRVSISVRGSDTVARIGGDEFTVILPNLDEASRVEQVADNIIEALSQPFRLGNEVVYISASVGITLYPNDATEVEDLLKNADQAMYVAKNSGRNCFSYFTSQMQASAQRRLHLIKDLRNALAAQEFRLYFQPIVELSSGQIVKAEALIRWQHPERGLVPPMEFIPLAEEVGLIGDIGDWVFRESARWMQRWHQQGRICGQVSVNKSPNQFLVTVREEAWLEYLRELGLPGECIVIEITEGLLLNERSEITAKLLQFRDAGILVAIDDFGTGYSSLAYLKKFDIDFLKIDRSFVRDLATDPNDLALSEAIIVMAHKLGLKVIAEGVETSEQRDMLAAAGCDYVQGYLYSRPMPAEVFDVLLASGATLG